MTLSALIQALSALKGESPVRLHNRIERLIAKIVAEGVEGEPPTPGMLGGTGSADSVSSGEEAGASDEPTERRICGDFLKAQPAYRKTDGLPVVVLWFQENGLSGGALVKIEIPQSEAATLLEQVRRADLALDAGINPGAE
jgi:hypothetical protein